MSDRSKDWFKQSLRDLDQAKDSQAAGRHEWACFAAHQAAEKAVKALHLSLKQEAWGHIVARLITELPASVNVPEDLIEKGRVWIISIYLPGTQMDIRTERHTNTTANCRATRRLHMPVRSLNSSVLKWPDERTVRQAVTAWANHLSERQPGIIRIGYFGSYARGDWGVGSDLDMLIVLKNVTDQLDVHAVKLELTSIPVPVDTLIYSEQEWQDLIQGGGKFIREIQAEAVWVFGS